MVAESYKYVVLGGGNAGGYAAREVTRSHPTAMQPRSGLTHLPDTFFCSAED